MQGEVGGSSRPVAPRHPHPAAVPWIDGDGQVARHQPLHAHGLEVLEGHGDAGHYPLSGQAVSGVEERGELRAAGGPVVVTHDDDVAQAPGSTSEVRGVHRPVDVHGRPDRRKVLTVRRPGLDATCHEVRGRWRRGGGAVQRHVDGGRASRGAVEVVVADVDAVEASARPAEHARCFDVGLVDARPGPVDEDRHGGGRCEVCRAQDVEPEPSRPPKDPAVQAAPVPESERDVPGCRARRAGDDRVERPGPPPVGRDEDRGVRRPRAGPG